MKFCKNCNSLIKLNSKLCSNCGSKVFIQESNKQVFYKNTKNQKVKEHKPSNTVDFDCPVCKGKIATYQIIQTRALDQSPTQFYTCINCGFCKRE
jgi:DNA-directed RNA polymerase subunit M/transcription elongation factor TFIIS